MKEVIISILILSSYILLGNWCISHKIEPQVSSEVEDYFVPRFEIELLATKYNPVKEQCDNDPLITADLSVIDLNKLNRHELRWVAVSRDMLDYFNYGDTIHIECENENLNGQWVIHDTMNPRWNNRIDFLVPFDDKYEFNKPIKVTVRI